jgi:nicotinate-nucleotide pyrophosphorylase (carboxylating)
MNYINDQAIQHFIAEALKEDVGEGDQTTLASIPENTVGEAVLKIKEQGIIAGIELAGKIFAYLEPEIKIDFQKKDGDKVESGEIAFHVKGKVRTILEAERLVLNCMQRMSGIATLTQQLTSMISHTKARLLDTRKTTPNFRIPEKWAVKIGGGVNHRFALYDMILLKDNHIDFAGGVSQAITAAKEYLRKTGKDLKIEVETRNLQEVEEAIKTGGIFRIMLDNMPPDIMKKAVELINGKYETEASGGITEKTIVAVAETGVDYISVGALTHSVKSLDLSLKAEIQ